MRQETTLLFQFEERMQKDDLKQKKNDVRLGQKLFGKNRAMK